MADEHVNMVINWVKENHTSDEVHIKLGEIIPDYLDDDWEDEFEDMYEANVEQGRGEAESQLLQELTNDAMSSLDLSAEMLSLDEKNVIFERIAEEYDINYH